jgi:RNA polymerase sigma factor (sigma-70 family)
MTLSEPTFDEKSLLPQYNPLPADRDQAWEAWQRGPGQRLLNYIRRLLDAYNLDPDFYAEEIFDDTILAAQREIECGNYEDQGFKLSSWIYTIARHKCTDELRRRRRHPNVALLDDQPENGPSVEQQVIDNLHRQQLHAAVDALPNNYRDPIRLHLQGWSNDEIAEKLGEACTTIRKRLQRAKEKLAAALNPDPSPTSQNS